jgi:catechol 2,3-dioxygenase-like lactoylglutathione lyase family enzyme
MSATPGPLQGQSLQASVTVKDLEKSVAWYEALGFAVSRRIERDGKLRGIAIHAGDVRVILNQDDGAKGGQDVDLIARRITEHGSKLDMEPKDMPWGARVFRVRDPDGFRWAISRATAV